MKSSHRPVALKLGGILESSGSLTPSKSESLGVMPRCQQVLKRPRAAVLVNTKAELEALSLVKKRQKESGQSLSPGKNRKAGKTWLLPVILVQTSFSLAEGFSQQPPSNQPRDAVLNFRSSAIEQRTL